MLLSTKDFISLIDFFNETIAIKSRGPEPEYDMGWQLEIEERFWLALLYEKSVTYKWKYYLKLDDAEFELPYENAIDLFKKLSTFKKRINEGLK